MRTPWITCAWRECRHQLGGVPYGPYDRLVVLEIVSAEFFVFGLTRCIAVNPDGTRPDLEAFRWLVGKEWSNYTRAVLEVACARRPPPTRAAPAPRCPSRPARRQIHKALRGHQTGVREYELFETYVVPDEPLAGKPFPKVGSRHSKVQRGGERYDVHYSPEPEVALLPVSMSATDTHPLTNRPRSDGKWIKVGECRPIVPIGLSKEDAAMGLLAHMPDVRAPPSPAPPRRARLGIPPPPPLHRDGTVPRITLRAPSRARARRARATPGRRRGRTPSGRRRSSR